MQVPVEVGQAGHGVLHDGLQGVPVPREGMRQGLDRVALTLHFGQEALLVGFDPLALAYVADEPLQPGRLLLVLRRRHLERRVKGCSLAGLQAHLDAGCRLVSAGEQGHLLQEKSAIGAVHKGRQGLARQFLARHAQQVAGIGNSVCPELAELLVKVNYKEALNP